MKAFSNKKRSSWFVTVPLAGGVLAYIFWSFIPGMKAIKELNAEIDKTREAIFQGEKLTLAVQATEKDLQEAREYNQAWRKAAPRPKQVAELFGRLHEVAKQTHVTATRLDPQSAVELDTLVQTPVLLGVSGSFREILAFSEGLESVSPSIWVSDFHLEPARENGKSSIIEVKLDVFADNLEILN